MSPKHDTIFILDIGTRKVAGVVVKQHKQGLKVLAACVHEHPDRAMLGGQVHRVEAVAKVVSQVKAVLEAELGITLTEAAVAAAGRALLTESAEQKRYFPARTEITREDVLALELSAARAAQTALHSQGNKHQLHCVGFSTIRFRLDNEVLDDLVGHQGQEMSVEVLATFLPRQVVDSLMAVLRRANLAARSLTLEPIAAIEATIPNDLRRMNIALVDVGAGTSDIAITRNGSVFAYAMVTHAGDEITERLCEHYLLEFNEAEKVKRALETAGDARLGFTTILGQKMNVSAAEIRQNLQPDVKKLAKAIADTIIKLNGAVPRAVVMVGGGSATPGLGPSVAEALKLDPSRVGCRGPETIPELENPTPTLKGIEGITPLGIALLASRGKGLRFITAYVNKQPIQLLALSSKPTVFEALLSAGKEMKSLHPRPGQAITYTLAGRLMTVPGTLGTLAEIKLNSKPATLDTVVQAGDDIELTAAVNGRAARLKAVDVPRPGGPFWCTCNGHNLELEPVLRQQDQPVDPEAEIPDRAELNWGSQKTLGELMPELSAVAATSKQVRFFVNGEQKQVHREYGTVILANRQNVTIDYCPRPNDRIEWKQTDMVELRMRDLGIELPPSNQISVAVNGKTKMLDSGGKRITINGEGATPDALVPENAEIVIEKKESYSPTLSHILEGLDLTPPPNAGTIQLMVDGQKAAFTTPLKNGSRIEIFFG
ncbi:pilus assembly protein PilM [bacterium]|nr:pilus assembly protein PilM [bacterium]